MPQVIFKATEKKKRHNGRWSFDTDGQIKKVPDDIANRLAKAFPDNFDIIDEQNSEEEVVETETVESPEEEKIAKPKRNRILKPGKKK